MKKTIMSFVTMTALAMATPLMANPFTGARVAVTAGVDDVTKSVDKSDVTYGGLVGFDLPVSDNVVVGLEANVDNLFNRRDIGVTGRLGYVVSDDTLLYVNGGYSNYSDVLSRKLDGLSVGAGVEHNLSDNVFLGASYKYTDFENGVGKNGVSLSFGVRF